ncbi:glycosyltransferase family 2 protein [Pseudomonas juntendi]|uniref:glycosyltransferase family 2 protein n=1 Tax=Pseudomonas juntendi TaxID=2666183 RepID=UPI0015F9B140|nr:glycosyltransferase family 2 protein [Pseudomonas juntendi]MBA6125307.1 glycosyltransferase family 2 protein [Pseudomonas juntendi]
MRPQHLVTRFSEANSALRDGDYVTAIKIYEQCKKTVPPLKDAIEFNLNFALNRLIQEYITTETKTKFGELIPLNQLERDPENEKYWISLGDDPHLQLDFNTTASLDAGWYRIDMIIDSTNENNIARVYLDYGDGYSEANSLRIPYKRKHLTTRVFYASAPLKTVRFDPKELEGRFAIDAFQWKNITEDNALKIMTTELTCQLSDDVSFDEEKLLGEMRLEAHHSKMELSKLLADKYNKLFEHILKTPSYGDWIEDFETPSLPSNIEAKVMFESFKQKPLISIVVPTYNTDDVYLRECIESVLKQSYPNWELCIADDASPNGNIRTTLEFYKSIDYRIKVTYRSKNGHISLASNSALKLAKGKFVALLDHDDLLPEHALLYVVEAINKNPKAQIFYSDEDKIDLQGCRVDPHFKSSWNPDLFHSQNYVSHLGVYKRTLLKRIGGFRQGVEGSQDYDLMLRCLLHVKDSEIIHIPRVLYHWRALEGSTALSAGQKSYTTDAGIKSLSDYFSNINKAVLVSEGVVSNTYRITWPIPDKAPLVSLLIPTRDRRSLTEVAVRSILDKSDYDNFEIIILDNGSTEKGTLEFFEQIQKEDVRVRVLRYDHPFNYSAINNYGVQNARGDIIGLVNNDVEVISPGWLREMVSHTLRKDVGCVGAKLYYSDGTIQHAGVICSIGGVAGHSHKHWPNKHPGYFSRLLLTQNLSAVTAACLLVRKSVYEEVGGLDEENLHVAFNDVDFCLKVRELGYRNVWTPHAELYHHESVSRGAEDTPEKIHRFNREVEFMKNKWLTALEEDPYYNPNLTKKTEDFSFNTKG